MHATRAFHHCVKWCFSSLLLHSAITHQLFLPCCCLVWCWLFLLLFIRRDNPNRPVSFRSIVCRRDIERFKPFAGGIFLFSRDFLCTLCSMNCTQIGKVKKRSKMNRIKCEYSQDALLSQAFFRDSI